MTSDLLINGLPHGRSMHRLLNAAILLAVASLTIGAIFFFYRMPLEPLLRDWSADDAFYYFQTARNYAQKGVIAFDGINVTNGFHALWFWALVPVYKLPLDPVGAIHAIKGIEVLIAAASFCCVLLVLKMLRVTWFFSLFAIPYLIRYKALYIGLEAGTSLLAMCASMVFCVYLLKEPDRLRRKQNLIFFSAFLIFAPLARLENALFAVTLICLVALFRLGIGVRFTLADLAALVLPFSFLMLLYFTVNYLVFESPVPVSALVKYWWNQFPDKNQSMLFAAWSHFWQMCRLKIVSHGILLGAAALAVMALSRFSRIYCSADRPLGRVFDGLIVSLFVFHFTKTVVYALMGSSDAIMADWYHVSGPLLSWMSIAYLADRTFALLAETGRTKYGPTFSKKCAMGLLVVGVCVSAATGKIVYDTITVYSTQSASKHVDWRIASYRMANWLNRNGKDMDRVGVFDSGIMGYFSNIPVVNLDGLINSVEYLRMLKSGKFEEFLRKNHIRYVANAITDYEERNFERYVAQRTGQRLPLTGEFHLVYRDEHNAFEWAGPQKYRLFRYRLGADQ